MKRYTLLCFLLFIAQYNLLANDEWLVLKYYDVGLPNTDHYNCVVIDKDNNIWVGGSGFVSVFDGKNWKSYTEKNSPVNGANSIAIDSNNAKWIASGNVLIKYKDGIWKSYTQYNSEIKGEVKLVFVDKYNNKWISSNDSIIKYDDKTMTVYSKKTMNINYGNLNCFAQDSLDNLWIGTGYGLVKYDGINWTVFNTDNSEIPGNNISSVAVDNNNIIWICSSGLAKYYNERWTTYNKGIYRQLSGSSHHVIDKNQQKIIISRDNYIYKFADTSFVMLDTTLIDLNHYSFNSLRNIVLDFNETKWIIHEDYLIKFNDSTWETYSNENTGMPGEMINCIAMDSKENKWMSSSNGGISKYDGKEWKHYSKINSGLPTDFIRKIVIDTKDNIWISTTEGLCKYDNTNWHVYNIVNSELPSNQIFDLEIDKNDIVWVCTSSGVVKIDNDKWTIFTEYNTILPRSDLRCITIDQLNRKWFGMSQCVAMYDDISWTIFNSSNSPIKWSVSAICTDSLNNIWINMSGLWKYDGNNWIEIDDNVYSIHSMHVDKYNNKWFGSENGILKYNDTIFTKFSIPDDSETNIIYTMFDNYDNKWFGSEGGLYIFREGGVTINIEEIDSKIEIHNLLNIYPNPFSENTTINFNLNESAFVSLTVSDLIGFEVKEIFNNKFMVVGEYKFQYYTNGIPAGVYCCRLSIGKHVETVKMFVLR